MIEEAKKSIELLDGALVVNKLKMTFHQQGRMPGMFIHRRNVLRIYTTDGDHAVFTETTDNYGSIKRALREALEFLEKEDE